MKKTVLAWLLLSWPFAAAAPGQIEFTAELKSVQIQGPETGVLVVALTGSQTLPVQVTGTTEIRDGAGDPLSLLDLAEGNELRLEAHFTDRGILARRIRVLATSDFTLRGRLDKVDVPARQIKLYDLLVKVAEDAVVRDRDGKPLPFESLVAGQYLEVHGAIGTGLVAHEIKVLGVRLSDGRDDDKGRSRISFEGIVQTIEPGGLRISVLVEGAGATPVRIHPNTEFKGELKVGAQVKVSGTLADDLIVDARLIVVQKLLELNPAYLKLRAGQTQSVALILQHPLEHDLVVLIRSDNSAVATPSLDQLTLPAGHLTAKFEVRGVEAGRARIDIKLPGDLGEPAASLVVGVGPAEKPEDKPAEKPSEKPPQAFWSPDKLRLKTHDRRVSLLAFKRQTAESEVAVTLSLVSGPAGVVQFPSSLVIPAGSRTVEVPFKSGETVGKVKIRADLAGTAAYLSIEVVPPNQTSTKP